MNRTVPCRITYSEEDMCWYVESPGFYSGIITYGNTLEEAKDMASEAISELIESYLDHGDVFHIPPMLEEADFYAIPVDPGLSLAV
jgi:predicted RNase H-like HicB family nuclease